MAVNHSLHLRVPPLEGLVLQRSVMWSSWRPIDILQCDQRPRADKRGTMTLFVDS
jgi:hypothetical protein